MFYCSHTSVALHRKWKVTLYKCLQCGTPCRSSMEQRQAHWQKYLMRACYFVESDKNEMLVVCFCCWNMSKGTHSYDWLSKGAGGTQEARILERENRAGVVSAQQSVNSLMIVKGRKDTSDVNIFQQTVTKHHATTGWKNSPLQSFAAACLHQQHMLQSCNYRNKKKVQRECYFSCQTRQQFQCL